MGRAYRHPSHLLAAPCRGGTHRARVSFGMTDAAHTRRGAPRPAAVLWDMDGTIVDTEPYWIECEYELVAEFGGEWDDEKAHSLVGRDLRDSALILRERGGVEMPIDDIVNRLLDGVIARVQRRVPWRPGARELLAALNKAGVPCAMVTMSWGRFADAVVKVLPRGTFAVVITGDEVAKGQTPPRALPGRGPRPRREGQRLRGHRGLTYRCAQRGRGRMPYLRRTQRGRHRRGQGLHRGRLPPRPRSGHPRRRHRWTRPEAQSEAQPAPDHRPLSRRDGERRCGDRRPRRDEPAPLADIPISAWAPYWVVDDATTSIAAHGVLLHEVSPFWYEARGATEIGLSANVTTELTTPLLATARQAGATIIPSIADVMGEGEMAAVLADPHTRAQHVLTIIALVSDNDFDGIDIDYERFAHVDTYSTWEDTRVNWVAFLTDLAAGLHADGKLLTVAVPPIYDTEFNPESGYWVYDYAAMGDIVDRIRIMAYDYSWAEPGPIAPIGWIRSAVRAAKDAVADDTKLVLGIPLYGRNWVIATAGICPADAPGRVDPNLGEVAALLAQYGVIPVHDDGTGEATFTYQRQSTDGVNTCTQTREVHYVDEVGVRARIDLAREERIGGVVLWALGFDTELMWEGIAAVARPRPSGM